MSFVPPTNSPNELGAAHQAQDRERELEAKAERYSRLHAGDDDRPRAGGAVRRTLRRIRRALGDRD